MNPGQELDALVAEKVMLWKLCSCTCGDIEAHIEKHNLRQLWTPFGSDSSCNACGRKVVDAFRPSTDISAAWETVEKMRADGFSVLVNTESSASKAIREERRDGMPWPHEWHCVFVKTNVEETLHRFGDTAPHAICLAALKAVGG